MKKNRDKDSMDTHNKADFDGKTYKDDTQEASASDTSKEANKSKKQNSSTLTKQQKKAQDKQKILGIQKQLEAEKNLAEQKRRDRTATLALLSKEDKKTYLANEKAEQKRKKREDAENKASQKAEYKAMPAEQRKAAKKQRKHNELLHRKAKEGYAVRQVLKYTLIAVLAAILVYAGNTAYGAFFDNSHAFQNTGQALATPEPEPTETPKPTVAATNAPTPTPTVDPYELLLSQADLDFMENRVNILVLGIDESLERANWGSFRTDTMILVSIDFETNDVYMLSLPRDSFVTIYNKNKRAKINSAFSAGGGKDKNGFKNTMDTVSMTLGGIPVNHYVCFDMNVVKEVVNAIGGLDYDVDIDVKMCGRTIEKGYQHLDGQMVLDYCRQRKGSSDIARADRQQRMIFAIFDEVKKTGQIQDIPEIYSAITGNIYTDLDFSQIVSLAAFGMNIEMDNMQRFMLPGDFLNIDGTSFWGVNEYKKRRMIEEIFGVRIKIDKDFDVRVLQELAKRKRDAVAAATSAATTAESYVTANSEYITAEELADYQSRITNLRTLAAVEQPCDVEPTIAPIETATTEFNTWFTAFKETIELRKAPPTPTPTEPPAPTEKPTPDPDPPAPTEDPDENPDETPDETPDED